MTSLSSFCVSFPKLLRLFFLLWLVTGASSSELPGYPRDEDICSDAAYDDFVSTKAANYDHRADLMRGGVFLWSVVDDVMDGDESRTGAATIRGMLSYNGLCGFLGLGFSSSPSGGGAHPMSGAIILMATPSEVYTPETGFELSQPAVVREYRIDEERKGFQYWSTPLEATSRQIVAAGGKTNHSSYAVEETDCFTAMSFVSAGIFDTPFNISGADTLIWAANGMDSMAGYHGNTRGRFIVNWRAGTVAYNPYAQEEDHSDHDHNDDDSIIMAEDEHGGDDHDHSHGHGDGDDDHHDNDDGHHDNDAATSSGIALLQLKSLELVAMVSLLLAMQ